MAGDPTLEVLQAYRTRLAALMPDQPQQDAGTKVPVYYSHPGDVPAVTAMVWFDNIEVESEVQSLRGDVRRRKTLAEFEVVVGVSLIGKTSQGATPEVTPLQLTSDLFALSIYKLIDLDVAQEEHLGSPSLVDVATVRGYSLESGLTANGCGSRLTARLEFQARYID